MIQGMFWIYLSLTDPYRFLIRIIMCEKIIIKSRKLKDKSITLNELGTKLSITKERVR